LWWKDPTFIWATLLLAAYIKGKEEGRSLFACLLSPCWQIHSFTGTGDYFFEISAYTEDAEPFSLED